MYQVEINDNVNFRSFGSALMLLMRCATGERWNSIMFELANLEGFKGVKCVEA